MQTLWDRTHWKALLGWLFRSCRQPSIPWDICVASSACVSCYTRSRWAQRKPRWWSKNTVVCIGYWIKPFHLWCFGWFFVPLNSDLQVKVHAQDQPWVRLPNFKTRRCYSSLSIRRFVGKRKKKKREWEAGKGEKPSSFCFPTPIPTAASKIYILPTPKEDLMFKILSLYLQVKTGLTNVYGLFMLKGRKRLEKSSSFEVQS